MVIVHILDSFMVPRVNMFYSWFDTAMVILNGVSAMVLVNPS